MTVKKIIDRTLAKTVNCPHCDSVKDITWEDSLNFSMGYSDSCYGHSHCLSCNTIQTHYAGSPEGAIEFLDFMEFLDSKESSSANDDSFH